VRGRRAFSEWKSLGDRGGGAILRAIKTRPGRSLYLYMEARATAVMRARLRFNRCALNQSLHKRALADSPLCAHPPCRRAQIEETVDHALLRCPRYSKARAACVNQLRRAGAGADSNPLSLPLLLGQVDLKKANSSSFSVAPSPVDPPIVSLRPFPREGRPVPFGSQTAARRDPSLPPPFRPSGGQLSAKATGDCSESQAHSCARSA